MKLKRKLRLLLGGSAMALTLATPLLAHHILGIPHYAYDKDYPQAPVITYLVQAGPYLVSVTGYPGRPAPQEAAQIHAFIRREGDETDVYSGPVEASLMRSGLGGTEVVWGPVTTRFEENLHKVSPRFGDEGNYVVRLHLDLEGEPYDVDFPIQVGDPSSPVATLAIWLGGLVLVILVLRAVRIKLARRAAARGGA